MERRDFLLSSLAGSLAAAAPAAFAQEGRRTPDVIYVPTPQPRSYTTSFLPTRASFSMPSTTSCGVGT